MALKTLVWSSPQMGAQQLGIAKNFKVKLEGTDRLICSLGGQNRR